MGLQFWGGVVAVARILTVPTCPASGRKRKAEKFKKKKKKRFSV